MKWIFLIRFPIKSHLKYLLLRKEGIRPNTSLKSWEGMSLWRAPACQILSKPLDISGAAAQRAPELLKTLKSLSDTTVRSSSVDCGNLKSCRKSEKGFLSWDDRQTIIYKILKDFTKHRRKLTGQYFLAIDLFSRPNTGITDKNFQQLVK